MFFNSMRSLKKCLFVVIGLISISACSRFAGNKDQEKPRIEVKSQELVCVDEIKPQFQKFLKAEATPQDVESSFQCLSKALVTFEKKTKGSLQTGYTSKDLFVFFKEYTKMNTLSESFFKELIEFKTVLIGGRTDELRKDEILPLVNLLSEVKIDVLKMLPYVKIYLFDEDSSRLNPKTIQDSVQVLTQALSRFLDYSKLVESKYTIEKFESFLKELFQVEPNEAIEAKIETLKSVKIFVLGDNPKLDSKKDWLKLVSQISKGLDISLRYYANFKNGDWLNPAKYPDLRQMIIQGLDILDYSFDLRERPIIPFADIDQLIHKVYAENMIEPVITEKTLIATYQIALAKILNVTKDPREISGFELLHLKNIRREFYAWDMAQKFILSQTQKTIRVSELKSQMNQFNVPKEIALIQGLGPFEVQDIEQSWQELKSIVSDSYAVHWTEQNKTVIGSHVLGYTYNNHDLVMNNLIRMAIRILMRAYAKNPSSQVQTPIQQLSFVESQWIQLYQDFRALGLELGFMDPRNQDSAQRSFKEGNFFTFAGNGDERLNFKETFQLMSFLISGGSEIYKEIRQISDKAQCQTKELDIFQMPFYSEACFQKTLRQNFSKLFNNLPLMSQFVAQLNESEWQEVYHQIMLVARVDQKAIGKIESGDIRSFAMIVEYVEVLFTIYDQNRSGTFDEIELENSFPRFSKFILNIIDQQAPLFATETFAQEVFIFMVYEGVVPEMSLEHFIKANSHFWSRAFFGLGEVNRLNIVKTLGALKSQMH